MENKVTLNIKCRCCNKPYTIKVDLDDLQAWLSGEKLVQDAFPYLNAGERELLLTKTCPTCWDKMFSQYDF